MSQFDRLSNLQSEHEQSRKKLVSLVVEEARTLAISFLSW